MGNIRQGGLPLAPGKGSRLRLRPSRSTSQCSRSRTSAASACWHSGISSRMTIA